MQGSYKPNKSAKSSLTRYLVVVKAVGCVNLDICKSIFEAVVAELCD